MLGRFILTHPVYSCIDTAFLLPVLVAYPVLILIIRFDHSVAAGRLGFTAWRCVTAAAGSDDVRDLRFEDKGLVNWFLRTRTFLEDIDNNSR